MKKLINLLKCELKSVINLWLMIASILLTAFFGNVTEITLPIFPALLGCIVVFALSKKENRWWSTGLALFAALIMQLMLI